MNLETSIATYLIVWWVVLFSVLPMGVVSHAEAGLKTPGGGDPASPVNPNLKRKFITTTWVSGLLFAPFWIAVHFHWISLGMLRNLG
jgi:predicted secreted protein